MMPRSKFTAARRKAILEALRKGHTLTHAAALAGVDRDTVYDWLARGAKAADEDSEYRKFAEAYLKANAAIADFAIEKIKAAMPDDWRAASTFLERRFPDEYGKRERHEVTGAAGEPIRVEIAWPGAPPEK